MKVSPKMKKILAITGGTTLFVVCAIAMTKCSNNGNARDAAQEYLVAQTARADSLQQLLTRTEQDRQAWMRFANAEGDTIRMLRSDSTLSDSIVVLNDSIEHLVAENDSLARQLNDCRGRRRASRQAPAKRANSNNRSAASSQSSAQVTTSGNNVVVVPATSNTNVTVNGGCGNTVNVNNGTINNYYAPAPASNTVDIESSASVTTTYVVKVNRSKCK